MSTAITEQLQVSGADLGAGDPEMTRTVPVCAVGRPPEYLSQSQRHCKATGTCQVFTGVGTEDRGGWRRDGWVEARAPYRTTPEKAWQHDLQIKADFPAKRQKDRNKTDIGMDSRTLSLCPSAAEAKAGTLMLFQAGL